MGVQLVPTDEYGRPTRAATAASPHTAAMDCLDCVVPRRTTPMTQPVPFGGPVTVGAPREVHQTLQPLRTAISAPSRDASNGEFRDSTVFSPRTNASANGSCRLSASRVRVWSKSIGRAGWTGAGVVGAVEGGAMASGGTMVAATEGAAGAEAAAGVAAATGVPGECTGSGSGTAAVAAGGGRAGGGDAGGEGLGGGGGGVGGFAGAVAADRVKDCHAAKTQSRAPRRWCAAAFSIFALSALKVAMRRRLLRVALGARVRRAWAGGGVGGGTGAGGGAATGARARGAVAGAGAGRAVASRSWAAPLPLKWRAVRVRALPSSAMSVSYIPGQPRTSAMSSGSVFTAAVKAATRTMMHMDAARVRMVVRAGARAAAPECAEDCRGTPFASSQAAVFRGPAGEPRSPPTEGPPVRCELCWSAEPSGSTGSPLLRLSACRCSCVSFEPAARGRAAAAATGLPTCCPLIVC